MMNGESKNIDVGIINNIPFIYVACFGNFTNVSYQTPRKLKKMFGKLGYVLFALKSIGQKIKRYHIIYEIDGIKDEGDFSFIFITNSSRVAGLNNIYNDVLLDDNKFEVALCDVKSKRDLIKTFYDGPFGFKIFSSCFKTTKAVRDNYMNLLAEIQADYFKTRSELSEQRQKNADLRFKNAELCEELFKLSH